jgi:hypothetical protein
LTERERKTEREKDRERENENGWKKYKKGGRELGREKVFLFFEKLVLAETYAREEETVAALRPA